MVLLQVSRCCIIKKGGEPGRLGLRPEPISNRLGSWNRKLKTASDIRQSMSVCRINSFPFFTTSSTHGGDGSVMEAWALWEECLAAAVSNATATFGKHSLLTGPISSSDFSLPVFDSVRKNVKEDENAEALGRVCKQSLEGGIGVEETVVVWTRTWLVDRCECWSEGSRMKSRN